MNDDMRTAAVIVSTTIVLLGTGILAFAAGETQPANNGFSADELIDGLMQRHVGLCNCRVSFRWSAYDLGQGRKLTLRGDFDVVQAGPLIKLQRTSYSADSDFAKISMIEHIAWNGQCRTASSERPEANPEDRFRGLISSDFIQGGAMGYWMLPILERMPQMSDADKFIADFVRLGTWRCIGRKQIGEYAAWGLANVGWVAKDYEDHFYEIWVVPDHGFAIVEMTDLIKAVNLKPMLVKLHDVHLQRFESKWVAIKAEVEVANPNVADPGRFAFTIDVKEYLAHLPAGTEFIVRFAKNTGVLDDRNQNYFISGRGVVQNIVRGGMRLIPIAQYPEYDSLTDASTGLTDAEWLQTPDGKALGGVVDAAPEINASVPQSSNTVLPKSIPPIQSVGIVAGGTFHCDCLACYPVPGNSMGR